MNCKESADGVQASQPADPFTVSAALRRLIADDAYAMTFQTMGQYRTALLKAIDNATAAAGVAPVEAPSGGPNPLEVSEAIHAAAAAIYFNDSSDYERALWTVLRKLSPAMADLMETDTGAAFLRVKGDAFEHATSGVGAAHQISGSKNSSTSPDGVPPVEAPGIDYPKHDALAFLVTAVEQYLAAPIGNTSDALVRLCNVKDRVKPLVTAGVTVVDAADPEAWYCESHPERLMGHDGCTGAGIQESCRIHMLLNKVRLAEQATRETAMVRDDLAARLRRTLGVGGPEHG